MKLLPYREYAGVDRDDPLRLFFSRGEYFRSHPLQSCDVDVFHVLDLFVLPVYSFQYFLNFLRFQLSVVFPVDDGDRAQGAGSDTVDRFQGKLLIL